MADNPKKDADLVQNQAMLDILKEKDNLIVSLKESSTRRDILNEKQIRLLSEDNQRKLEQLNNIQLRFQGIESQLSAKQAELELVKITEDKLTGKITDFKIAFEKYKQQVRIALDQIKSSINNELTRRDEYKNKILDDLKDNYIKLEAQIHEVDNYYREILAEITKKQGVAKKYIRHALNDLQESLSLLDLSHGEYIEPIKIKEEFTKVAEGSSALFEEFKEMKGLPQGQTIIENIENVNIQLSQVPEIDGVFKEIKEIHTVAQEKMADIAEKGLKTGLAGAAGAGPDKKGLKSEAGAGSGAGKEIRPESLNKPEPGHPADEGSDKKQASSDSAADAGRADAEKKSL